MKITARQFTWLFWIAAAALTWFGSSSWFGFILTFSILGIGWFLGTASVRK